MCQTTSLGHQFIPYTGTLHANMMLIQGRPGSVGGKVCSEDFPAQTQKKIYSIDKLKSSFDFMQNMLASGTGLKRTLKLK